MPASRRNKNYRASIKPRGAGHKGRQPLKVDKRSFTLNADEWVKSGKWVWVKSSWVKGIMFDYDKKSLYVEYHDNAVCKYDHISIARAKSMFTAGSMGKFVHRWLYNHPYVLVR